MSEQNTPTTFQLNKVEKELKNIPEQSTQIATDNHALPAPSPKPTQSKEDHISQWLTRELEHIFKITLDSNKTSSSVVFA